MINLRYRMFAALSVLFAVFLFGRYYKGGTKGSNPLTNVSKPVILKPADKEEILVNPLKHTITVVTAKGSTTTTLPDRDSEIDITKKDEVRINAPQIGFEHIPFAGVYYSNALRFGGGVDLGYFKRLDVGLGAAGGSGINTVGFVQLSYAVYDNARMSVMYDHLQHIGIGLSIRI
jgi:hypothetical protein